MGLLQEGLRPIEIQPTFSGINPGFQEATCNPPLIKEAGQEARLRELSQLFFAEQNKEEGPEKQPQSQTSRRGGFEPFVNPEPTENPLFINGYTGSFAQQMELNRKGIERVLKIAHLDGKAILTSLNPLRQRSIEANPDGSVTRKRFLLFGEKIKDEDINPLRRVVSTLEGWRIEINDTGIREELEKKNLTGKKLQTEFIQQFNRQFKRGILESIWREKLSSEKDRNFRQRLFYSTVPPLPYALLKLLKGATMDIPAIEGIILGALSVFAIINIIGRKIPMLPHRINVDSPIEIFMPYVEIDKVIRSAFFLGVKSSTLIKERKPEVK
ncbi:MAG: hypothetical protein HY425_01955 [Candidatus Levybacteria bacterium]|nr:hypothetical protein [Candidatus Levybacteria bacterium]